MSEQPLRWAALGTRLATVALVFAGIVLAATIIGGIAGAVTDERDVAVDHRIDPEAITALPPGVEAVSDARLTVKVEDASDRQVALATARDLGPVLLAIPVIALLRGIVRSARDGDPFISENVQRLRRIGFVLLIAFPAVMVATSMLDSALRHTIMSSDGLSLSIPGPGPVASLGVFLLAEVFAYGIHLREDVEGTV